MASEMRRMAKLLVSRRAESFASLHPLAESVVRLKAATTSGPMAEAIRGQVGPEAVRLLYGRSITRRTRCIFEGAWKVEAGAVRLEGEFVPTRPTRTFLSTSSFVLTALVLATLYALFSPQQEASMKILLAVFTGLSIAGFPFVVVAMGSHREVEEMGIARGIRAAIARPDDGAPAPASAGT